MLGKLARMPKQGSAVWVDPLGYRAAVAERKGAFEKELREQQAGGRK
jgi:metallo-beta-lactamase class B